MKQIAKLKDEARKYEQKEEWQKAINAYAEVLKLGEAGDGNELDLPLYNRVGDLYVRLGRPMDAVKYYEQAADKYAEVGLHNNAIALCNKALRYDANRVELLKKLGQFSASQGFFTDARRWYLEYCEKMSKRGAMDEAFVALTELANVHDDAEIRELLGRQLKEHGRTEQAIVEYKRAYALHVSAGNTKAADELRAELEALGSDVSAAIADPGQQHATVADELPGFLDAPPPIESVGDGLVEEAPANLGFETMTPGAQNDYAENETATDFGTIDLDMPMGGAPPAPSDVQPLDIGLEPTLEFAPPGDAEAEEETEEETADEDSSFELPTFEAEDTADEDFGDADMALPTLEDDFGGQDLPSLDDHQTDEGEPLPLMGLDDGAEFGEEETGGEPLPLSFDIVDEPPSDEFAAPERAPEPEAFIPDPEPEAEPEPEEPEPEPEPEPVAKYEEPPRRPEPAPVAAAPAAPPPAPAPAKKKSDYVDLASFLGDDDDEEEAAADSTRFVVAEKPPTGDEEQDFADMLEQFKAKVAETIPKEDAGSHYDLGLAFKEMGLIDEAIAEFQTALRGGQEKLKVYEELGNCFVQKQQYSVAVTILNRAAQMPFNDETELLGVYYNLGRAHEELGQRAEAKAAYERIISVDIGFQDTTARLAKL